MKAALPEWNKKRGLFYATTNDGFEVPIIDVTHPAFALEENGHELAAAVEKAVAEVQKQQTMKTAEQQAQLMALLKDSFLAPKIADAQGKILGGMSTYFLKLGPQNLGDGYATAIDRTIAGSLPCLSARLRLQHAARLIARSAAEFLEADPGADARFVNIAGGPGMDTLNALLLLRKERPILLENRAISIHVLDPDSSGPAFGKRALEVLCAPGGPLDGLAISMEHVPYDWADTSTLRQVLHAARGRTSMIMGSSEGGLFEYGTDEQIVSNLSAFSECAGIFTSVVGTVSRSDGAGRILNTAGGAALHLRPWHEFDALAHAAGWEIEKVEESPLSRDALLRRISRP